LSRVLTKNFGIFSELCTIYQAYDVYFYITAKKFFGVLNFYRKIYDRRNMRRSILFSVLSAEEFVQLAEGLAYQQVAAFVAGDTAGNVCAVVASLFGLFGGQIGQAVAGKLDKEGL